MMCELSVWNVLLFAEIAVSSDRSVYYYKDAARLRPYSKALSGERGQPFVRSLLEVCTHDIIIIRLLLTTFLTDDYPLKVFSVVQSVVHNSRPIVINRSDVYYIILVLISRHSSYL